MLLLSFRSQAQIILAGDEWMPFTGDEKVKGYIIELAEKIFKNAGMSFSYYRMPWARVLNETAEGNVSGAAGMLKKNAPDFVFHEEPAGFDYNAVFVFKSRPWEYSGRASFKKLTIGVIKDYPYGEEIDDYIADNIKNMQRIQVNFGEDPLKANILKMDYGRIDAIVENPLVFYWKIKDMRYDLNNYRMNIISGQKTPLYIGFTPKNPDSPKYAEIFSAGIREMRLNGELEKLLNKYGLKDWK
jgi:polar amino acid transport system substrate-binding protein